jgi:hypothetical protein
MAKNVPSYDTVRHTGVAAGDDAPADKLVPYDTLKYGGISVSSQADGLSAPAPTGGWTQPYPAMQNPGDNNPVAGMGSDTAPHGVGPKKPGTKLGG